MLVDFVLDHSLISQTKVFPNIINLVDLRYRASRNMDIDEFKLFQDRKIKIFFEADRFVEQTGISYDYVRGKFQINLSDASSHNYSDFSELNKFYTDEIGLNLYEIKFNYVYLQGEYFILRPEIKKIIENIIHELGSKEYLFEKSNLTETLFNEIMSAE